MKTDNELIAEFMDGFNYSDDTKHLGMNLPFKSNVWYDYDDMRFNTSWDWLMPVILKAKRTPHSADWGWSVLNYSLTRCCITDVYIEIVQFIKWYNERTIGIPNTVHSTLGNISQDDYDTAKRLFS